MYKYIEKNIVVFASGYFFLYFFVCLLLNVLFFCFVCLSFVWGGGILSVFASGNFFILFVCLFVCLLLIVLFFCFCLFLLFFFFFICFVFVCLLWKQVIYCHIYIFWSWVLFDSRGIEMGQRASSV